MPHHAHNQASKGRFIGCDRLTGMEERVTMF
jgi:hypothetical protein